MTTRLSTIFVLVGIIIGVFFAAQFQTDIPLDSAFPADQYLARQHLIKSFIDEQGVFRNTIANLNRQIDEQRKKNEASLSRTKLSLLDNLKRDAGLSPVTGSGMEILLTDSSGANRESTGVVPAALIQASDLRDLINVLRSGNPDAMAINNQRLLATTAITAVGANILVGNFYIAPPFIVTVVGDESFLSDRLKDPLVLAELKKRATEFKLQIDLTIKSHLKIPSYNGDFRLKYVQHL